LGYARPAGECGFRSGRSAAESLSLLVKASAKLPHIHVERERMRVKFWLDSVDMTDNNGFPDWETGFKVPYWALMRLTLSQLSNLSAQPFMGEL
jgi:hypothetical protein